MEGNIEVKVERKLTITWEMNDQEAAKLFDGINKFNQMLPNRNSALDSLLWAINQSRETTRSTEFTFSEDDEPF